MVLSDRLAGKTGAALWYNRLRTGAGGLGTRNTQMVLETRKWRLLVRVALLILTGVLIFGWAGPALYALQKAEPAPILGPAQLDDQALAGRFATVEGTPDLERVVVVHEAG